MHLWGFQIYKLPATERCLIIFYSMMLTISIIGLLLLHQRSLSLFGKKRLSKEVVFFSSSSTDMRLIVIWKWAKEIMANSWWTSRTAPKLLYRSPISQKRISIFKLSLAHRCLGFSLNHIIQNDSSIRVLDSGTRQQQTKFDGLGDSGMF